MSLLRVGPTNTICDVPGVRVGHATRGEPGWLTGCTVVLPPAPGAVCGVDVRGGGPGTRETDLLDPRNLVDRVNAILLGGGSAFGLAAADGVMDALADAGMGWPVGTNPGEVVPIVPAAICYDLGRGGDFRRVPRAEDGRAAYEDARDACAQGCVGAGTGAKAGGFKGGVGSASAVLPDGTVVGAVVVVNSVGSPVDPHTGELYARSLGLDEEFAFVGAPNEQEAQTARETAMASADPSTMGAGMATTIGVIATDAVLTKAQCQKLAGVGHDGMARAIRPVHSMFDGDTLFAFATGARDEPPDPTTSYLLLDAAASCVGRAIGHAMLAASTVHRAGERGSVLRSWRDAFPSALISSDEDHA